MLYNRRYQHKLIDIGYRQIYFVLEYIKYSYVYRRIEEVYVNKDFTTRLLMNERLTLYEETIDISHGSITGIRMILKNDPVKYLEMANGYVQPYNRIPILKFAWFRMKPYEFMRYDQRP